MNAMNKWQALSMKDRAFLIRESVKNGITSLDEIRDLYNNSNRLGVPYRTFESGSDYDYYNAAPENMPENNDGHWTSRNPHTGQILKHKDHPTYYKTIQGERDAGYEIRTIGDREYSFPIRNHQFSGVEGNAEEAPGILKDAWDTVKGWFSKEEEPYVSPTEGPVDLEEIKRRQAWAESKFNTRARSHAGAKGTFQIMEAVKKDYINAGGKNGNLYDPKYNEKVRDWYFSNLGQRQWVTKGNPSDSVKVGKQLAAYNAGPGNILKGLTRAKQDGLDIYNTFDWVNTTYLPKETVDYVNWTLRNKTTGSHRNDSIYNLNKHKFSGEEPVEIPEVTVFSKAKRRLSDGYYHLFKTPRDYCRERTTIDDCAAWSNKQLQKNGKSIFGHAWTRNDNKNITKVISGYNRKNKPSKYNIDEVRQYLFDAADAVKDDINLASLQNNDIVGMFFRGSPSQEKAWREGVRGEVHTHTGHIELNKRGIPFVVHNVHGDIRKNKAKKLLGSKRPYGITSIYRPK